MSKLLEEIEETGEVESKEFDISQLTDEQLVDKLASGQIKRDFILISDRKITKAEENLLLTMDFDVDRFSYKEHKRENINTIGHGDFFIVELDNPFWGGRSKASLFLEPSMRHFHDYIVIFLRTGGKIRKDNVSRFQPDFVINQLPTKTEDRSHYIRLLLVDKLPQVRGKLRQALHWITSKNNKKK